MGEAHDIRASLETVVIPGIKSEDSYAATIAALIDVFSSALGVGLAAKAFDEAAIDDFLASVKKSAKQKSEKYTGVS